MSASPKKPFWIIGIDEVGRGPLAGPVYVGVCAMRFDRYTKTNWRGLKDSKQLGEQARIVWEARAREMEAEGILRIAIGKKSAKEIDRIGIAPAIKTAIRDALETLFLDSKTTRIELDGGLHAPEQFIYQETFIKGDQKRKIISLASVVAKVARDRYMIRISKKYPQFGWAQNKGYGTRAHLDAMQRYQLTPLHRKTFLKHIIDK